MRFPNSIAYHRTIRVNIPFQVCVPQPNHAVSILGIILAVGFEAYWVAQAPNHIYAKFEPATSKSRNKFSGNQTRVSKVFAKIVFHLQTCLKVVRPPIWGLNFKAPSLLHFIKVRWINFKVVGAHMLFLPNFDPTIFRRRNFASKPFG